MGSETRSGEHAKRVDASRTFDIADHAGGGAVPGSAGTVITSGACGITERAATREGIGQAAERIEQRLSLGIVIVQFVYCEGLVPIRRDPDSSWQHFTDAYVGTCSPSLREGL